MTQPALRTPALDTSARAALAAEFARALESPGLRPLPPRLTGALFPRFARYYDQLLHLPRRTRRALQRRWKRSLAALALLLALGQAPPALAANFEIPCSSGVGDGAALIQAINDANNGTTNPDADSITLV